MKDALSLPVFAAAHFPSAVVAAATGSDKPNNSYNDALIRLTRRVCNNQTENKKGAGHDSPVLLLSLNNVSLTGPPNCVGTCGWRSDATEARACSCMPLCSIALDFFRKSSTKTWLLLPFPLLTSQAPFQMATSCS